MSAPKLPALPPCPVCGDAPEPDIEAWALKDSRYRRQCMNSVPSWSHQIIAYGRTQAEADRRWRRIAGGAR